MFSAILFTSTIVSSVLSAPSIPSVNFHDWYLDFSADQALRQEKNLAQYEEKCAFKGAMNSNGVCDFMTPRILFPKLNTDGVLSVCPTGYALETNRCRWLELKDPFSTIFQDGKWWFVAEKEDKDRRLSLNAGRTTGLRDATCPDTLGFSGKLEDGKCAVYAPLFIKSENSVCPRGYIAKDTLCEWDGANHEMISNPISLAYTQADPLYLSVLKTVNDKVSQTSTNTNVVSSKMILSAIATPN